MRNKYLLILLTCIAFLIVCFIGLKELFTVRDIQVDYTVFDEENVETVTEILDEFKGKNIFFVNTDAIKNAITSNMYLKVTDVKKVYPCEIRLSLAERSPNYYYQDVENGGYYIFDEEFFVITKSEEKPAILDGIIGVGFNDKYHNLKPSFELKKQIVFDYNFNEMLVECCNALGEFRSNFSFVGLVAMPEENNYRVVLKTTEGVVMEIRNADKHLSSKVEKGIECYKTLDEGERIANTILVYDDSDGIRCDYTRNAQPII